MKLLALALIAAFAAAPLPATAATYVVNTLDLDLPDADTSLAGCDGNPIQAGDQCTLRAAIMQANAGASADTIVLPLDATITLTIAGTGGAESGDLDITQPVAITGAPLGYPEDEQRLPAIVAANSNRIFDVTSGVAVELRGLRLSGGNPSGLSGTNGGALRVLAIGANVLVEHSKLSSNLAVDGGAISTAGTLTVVDSDLWLNRVTGNGASLYVTGTGTATVRASSVRGVEDESAQPEALYVAQGGALRVENTVLNGGTDPAEPTGTGGIYADRPQLLLIRNSTIAGFSTTGVSFVADGDTAVSIYNSILADSDGPDCNVTTLPGDPADVRIAYNLIEEGNCNAYFDAGNQIGVDPLLEPLTSTSGSFVLARRIFFGSPAVDRGVPPDLMGGDPQVSCLGTDQRGNNRPQDGDADTIARCDIGSYESNTLVSSTYIVNVFNQDLLDLVPGDNHCDAVNVTPGDQCTLRAAMMEANAHDGPDRIEFIDGGADNTVTLTLPGLGGTTQGDLDVFDALVVSGRLENGRPITTITTDKQQRLFEVDLSPGYTARFENLRLVGGNATGAGDADGGAIRLGSNNMVEVDTVEFADNAATTRGGAIEVLDGQMIVRNSDFHGNSVQGLGAAIYAEDRLTIERSSIWGNQNSSGTEREAIRVTGAQTFGMFNSTVSGNSGGVWAVGIPALDLRQNTFYDNTQYGLRAVEGILEMQVSLLSTVITGSGVQDCSVVAGAVQTGGYNLVDDGSCAQGGTNLGGAPMLAPALARLDNEVTRVHFPLNGSPLIDVVPDGDLGCLDADQRGSVRPTDSDSNGVAKCEIGALELFQAEAAPKNFIVNLFDQDRDDSNPGDTLCDTSSNPGPQCTLRAAVMESNALPGANSIQITSAGAVMVLTQAPEAGTSAAHGDLDITDAVTIAGVSGNPGVRPTVSASMGERIFNVNAPGDEVAISGLKLTGGNSPGTGGALRVINADSVTVQRVGMYGNTANQGGGAVSVVGGTVTLEEVDMLQNGTVAEGAAIRNQGTLTLSRSSVRGNIDASPIGQREAISVVGGGTTFVLNSTVADNNGNGIDVDDGTLDVENTTIYGNDQRGIEFQRITGRTLFLRNTILSGNTDGGCTLVGAGFPTASVDGYNFTQSYGCTIESGASNFVTADPQLGALVVDPARYTAYYLPQAGSPVRDTGHPIVGGVGCLANDQFGTARAIDGDGNGSARCDIGAIEAATAIEGDELFEDSFEVPTK